MVVFYFSQLSLFSSRAFYAVHCFYFNNFLDIGNRRQQKIHVFVLSRDGIMFLSLPELVGQQKVMAGGIEFGNGFPKALSLQLSCIA